MTNPLTSVVIVGGGSAGWLTAGTLAAKHGHHIAITLIESPTISSVGVGEGTWPTMRNTLRNMGISETEFFRRCDVSFKQGAKFSGWVDGGDNDFYYHPLVLPTGFAHTNLAPYWQQHGQGRSFAGAVCFQEALCESNRAPKHMATPEYEAVANYAYHLDAGKFGQFLKAHCIDNLGVRYIADDVVDVIAAENGDIGALKTAGHGLLTAGLYIDCSGFRSLLLGEHYRVPWVDKSHILFADTAYAVQVPYLDEDQTIAPYTQSTAQDAGWIWDIGLQSRRGVGYVFSSQHTTESAAEQTLSHYLRPQWKGDIGALDIRKIPIKPGHRQIFWKNNCVAVGLSAGFLEPLEASALVLVELAAEMLSEQLPSTRGVMDIIAKRFNDAFLYRWDRIVDFLKLHYCVSERSDNDFWIDNRRLQTIPQSLQELLQLWRYQHPWHHDFTDRREVFPGASYQYVLYGMGFKTDGMEALLTPSYEQTAQRLFQENQRMIAKASSLLPDNRELLVRLHQYEFQKL